MKFVISSTELLGHLQSISKVISPKNTLPILDNFLFNLEDKRLEITASDLETTLVTQITIENAKDSGAIAIPARLLTDILKEFPEQPLTFDINLKTLGIIIHSEKGQYKLSGQGGINEYPVLPTVKDAGKNVLKLSSEALNKGISKTIFATSDDELRPIMNGILFELNKDNLTFVASDAQKLVKYQRTDIKASKASAFVLPKKPANLLKNILPKEKGDVTLTFDDKNAMFTLAGYTMVCRLVEGQFPNYNSVIPTNNPNKVIVDRLEFHNVLRRVSVCANQASNLVKLQLSGNQISVSAQDIDFSISGQEVINCKYEGDAMEIGFKSTFLVELASNLSSVEVLIELSDPSRAGLIKPVEKEDENEEILMLLMPMMINA